MRLQFEIDRLNDPLPQPNRPGHIQDRPEPTKPDPSDPEPLPLPPDSEAPKTPIREPEAPPPAGDPKPEEPTRHAVAIQE